jgi:hypothetical protein
MFDVVDGQYIRRSTDNKRLATTDFNTKEVSAELSLNSCIRRPWLYDRLLLVALRVAAQHDTTRRQPGDSAHRVQTTLHIGMYTTRW